MITKDVYAVTSGKYSDCKIESIETTKDNAKLFISRQENPKKYRIEKIKTRKSRVTIANKQHLIVKIEHGGELDLNYTKCPICGEDMRMISIHGYDAEYYPDICYGFLRATLSCENGCGSKLTFECKPKSF